MMCFMKIRVCPFAVYAANLASPQLNAVLLLYSRQCAEVCELRMRYRDLFEGMLKTLFFGLVTGFFPSFRSDAHQWHI